MICALAEFLGIGAAAIWYGGVHVLLGEPALLLARIGVWLLMTLAAVPEGVILGGLQALGIRWYLHAVSGTRWILATIAVGYVGWGIGTFIPMFIVTETGAASGAEPGLAAAALFASAFGMAAGAVFGVAQAWALPAGTERKTAWIAANTVGWALGLPAIYIAAQLAIDYPDWLSRVGLWSVGGLVAGVVIGLATGIALMVMADRQPETANL